MNQLADKGMASLVESYSYLSIINSRKGNINQAEKCYSQAADEMDRTNTTYFDKIWIHLARAELLAAKQQWDESWTEFEELYKFVVELNFLWFASYTRLIWISNCLKRGEPEDLEKSREMLSKALAEFQDIGADGFVELVTKKMNALY